MRRRFSQDIPFAHVVLERLRIVQSAQRATASASCSKLPGTFTSGKIRAMWRSAPSRRFPESALGRQSAPSRQCPGRQRPSAGWSGQSGAHSNPESGDFALLILGGAVLHENHQRAKSLVPASEIRPPDENTRISVPWWKFRVVDGFQQRQKLSSRPRGWPRDCRKMRLETALTRPFSCTATEEPPPMCAVTAVDPFGFASQHGRQQFPDGFVVEVVARPRHCGGFGHARHALDHVHFNRRPR